MTYNSIILEFKSPITLDQRLSFFYQFFSIFLYYTRIFQIINQFLNFETNLLL